MEDSPQPDRLSQLLARAYLVLCLTYMVWAVWTVALPEHRRMTLKLGLLKWSAQVMNRLARRAGAASIRQEAVTGHSDYTVPYRLSVTRDALMASYDRARGAL